MESLKQELKVSDSKLITLESAMADKDIKVGVATQLLGGIATQLGIANCISVFEKRAYINESTCLQINDRL